MVMSFTVLPLVGWYRLGVIDHASWSNALVTGWVLILAICSLILVGGINWLIRPFDRAEKVSNRVYRVIAGTLLSAVSLVPILFFYFYLVREVL